ncbi:hypothetical protein CJ030_MR1G015678 [Morella rubra]|uniref:Uncharacterized protein n=1 Tax=Morella rubra TaxID=262757 RepID=A0A6A1WJC5_9ROSI|nr:hypothetical protein CJ030_MR1G015678 [Morella rubra]
MSNGHVLKFGAERSYDNNIATIRAIKNGILEFVDMCLWLINDPSFSWITDEKSRNVLFLAVLHRQHEIFNRISRDDGLKEDLACQKDDDGNTLLHMAGMPPDFTKLNRIPGAALQMQRELQWFKEVQKIVPAKVKEATNKDGLTAHEFFTKNHMSLLKEGSNGQRTRYQLVR